MMGLYDLFDLDYLLVDALDFLRDYLHSVFHFFQLPDKDSLVFHIGGLRNLMFQFLNLRVEMFDDQLMFVEFVDRTDVDCFLLENALFELNFVEMLSDFDTFLVSLCFDEFLFEDDLLLFEVFDFFDGCDLLHSHVVDLNTVMERLFLDV